MIPRSAALVVSVIVFALLQWSKPMVFMQVYKFAFNFYPSIMTDFELYKLVWAHIFEAMMAAKVTISMVIGEVVWLIAPYFLYQQMVKKNR